MNKSTPYPDGDRREAAAAWLVRLQSDDASEPDWIAFEQWLGDPDNKAALDAVERAQAEFEDRRPAIAAALKRRAPALAKSPNARPRSLGWILGGAMAAAAAVVVMFALPWLAPRENDAGKASQQIAYSAPQDAMLPVTLADGSTMVLNRGGMANVSTATGGRRVEIVRGEASFKVKHNDAAPFTVAAGSLNVRDVGTEFNVLLNAGNITVTVREGVVEATSPGMRPARVSGGQELTFSGDNNEARLLQVNPDDAFAWQQGRLVFRDAPLTAVLSALNRYGDMTLRLEDPTLGALRFSGVLMIQPSKEMAAQLQAFLPIRSVTTGGDIVIRSR